MKRPRTFFLVVVWFSIVLLMQFREVWSLAWQLAADPGLASPIWYLVPFVGLFAFIWLIRGLVRLQPFHRWFAIVVFVGSTVMVGWRAMVLRALTDVNDRVYVFVSVAVALNVLCAWYLARRSFREFAVQYVADRKAYKHTRDMIAAAEKNYLHEISKGQHR